MKIKLNQLIAYVTLLFFVGSMTPPPLVWAQTVPAPTSVVSVPVATEPEAPVIGPLPEGSFLIQPTADNELSYKGLILHIPKGAVAKPLVIQVATLAEAERLNPGMSNATGTVPGYRLLPHGTQFQLPISLGLPFDPASVREEGDIQNLATYWYNDRNRLWERITTVEVDQKVGYVFSQTTHFSDYINSVLKLPDSPKPLSWNPNSIKDLKTADPSAGITKLQLPKANSQGVNGLGFPLELPQGRNGMEPRLALAYSEAGGESWTGLGWDLSLPAIVVDSKWGVPTFDGSRETETYILDGQELQPKGNSASSVSRVSNRQFFPEVERAFSKIIRHGGSPGNYWWEVQGKDGHARFFGSADGSDFNGTIGGPGIAKWQLVKETDQNGNWVKYHYRTDSDAVGKHLYPDYIEYTGNGTEGGAYRVNLLTSTPGGYNIVDGRGGYLDRTTQLLDRVEVRTVSGNTLLRSYVLNYVQGQFSKHLIKDIVSLDGSGAEHYRYTNDYFNNGLNFGSKQVVNLPSGSNSLRDNSISIPGLGSALGMSTGVYGGGSLYVGFGPGGSFWSKVNTIGVKFGINANDSAITTTMMDIDGDLLPDIVYRIGTQIFYHKQRQTTPGVVTFDGARLIDGLNAISHDYGHSLSIGIEGTLGIESASTSAYVGYSSSKASSSIFFADLNGDGLPDIVKDDQAYYNRPSGSALQFTTSSSGTPFYIQNGSGAAAAPIDMSFYEAQRLEASPLVDSIRLWKAPYTGTILIDGQTATLLATPPNATVPSSYTTRDGVKLQIQVDNTVHENVVLNVGASKTFTPFSMAITKSQYVYFRVNSLDDAMYDVVSWSPTITYTAIGSTALSSAQQTFVDPNGQTPYRFNAAVDFASWGESGLYMAPTNGTLGLAASIKKIGATSGSVTVNVTKQAYTMSSSTGSLVTAGSPVVLFSQQLAGAELATIDLATVFPSVSVSQYDSFTVDLVSDSQINQNAIEVAGTWTFTDSSNNVSTQPFDANFSRFALVSSKPATGVANAYGGVRNLPISLTMPDWLTSDASGRLRSFAAQEIITDTEGGTTTNDITRYIPDGKIYLKVKNLSGNTVLVKPTGSPDSSYTETMVLHTQWSGGALLQQQNHYNGIDGDADGSIDPVATEFTSITLNQPKAETLIFEVYGEGIYESYPPAISFGTLETPVRADGKFELTTTGSIPVSVKLTDTRVTQTPVSASVTVTLKNEAGTTVGSPVVLTQSAFSGTATLATSLASIAAGTYQVVLTNNNPTIMTVAYSDPTAMSAGTTVLASNASLIIPVRLTDTRSDTTSGPVTMSARVNLVNPITGSVWTWRDVSATAQGGSSVAEADFGTQNAGAYQFSITNLSVNTGAALASNYATVGRQSADPDQSYALYVPYFDNLPISGGNRQWSTIGYNNATSSSDTPINQSMIVDAAAINAAIQAATATDPTTGKPVSKPRLWFVKLAPDATGVVGVSPRFANLDKSIWVNGTYLSASRLTDDKYPHYPTITFGSAGSDGSQSVAAKTKISWSDQFSISAGVSVPVPGLSVGGGAGFTYADTHSIMDSMDLNGDGFPDMVSGTTVTYTNANGTLGNRQIGLPGSAIRKTDTYTTNLNANVSIPVASGGGYTVTLNGHLIWYQTPTQVSLSFSPDVQLGGSTTDFDYQDMNADGLPDRVKQNGSSVDVYYNTGYGFAGTAVTYNNGTISDAGAFPFSLGIGLGGGFHTPDYAFSAGVSVSTSSTEARKVLMDMNGDGIPDAVNQIPGGIEVVPGTGQNFNTGDIKSDHQGGRIRQNIGYQAGASASFTVGFTIFGAVKFVVNPAVAGGVSAGATMQAVRDVDGDGLPDIVIFADSSRIEYFPNMWGKTNLLRSVTSPLGATYTLDYTRLNPTFEHPSAKYVLTDLTINDGVPGDGVDVTRVRWSYGQGHHDRGRREFYGYQSLTEEQLDENGIVARTTVHSYNTSQYWLKGLETDTAVYGYNSGSTLGRLFQLNSNTYDGSHLAIQSGVPEATRYNPQLTQTTTKTFDYDTDGTQRVLQGGMRFDAYDAYGNPTDIVDLGRDGSFSSAADDDIKIHIDYLNPSSKYVHSLPTSLVVTDVNGTVLRKRIATYTGAALNLGSIQQTLSTADGTTATYNYQYDGYGNLNRMDSPDGYFVTYSYDLPTHSRPANITDGHGISSTADYDLWGNPIRQTDSAGQIQLMEYDSFQRLVAVWAPYDLDSFGSKLSSIPAVRMNYTPASGMTPAYAVTKNKVKYDPYDTTVLETVITVDGLGRVVQTKKRGVVYGADLSKHDGLNVSGTVVYNALGQAVAVGQPYFESGLSLQYGLLTPPKNATLTDYDAVGRPIRTRIPKTDHGTDQLYSGPFWTSTAGYRIDESLGQKVTSSVDFEGHTSRAFEDPRGNKVALERDYLNVGVPSIERTSYSYNLLGEILAVVDTNANSLTATYDQNGRRLTLQSGDAGLQTFTYDGAGNLITTKDANDKLIVHTYNKGRITKTEFPDKTPVLYAYDTTGRVNTVQSSGTTTTYTYGKLGETTQIAKVIPHILDSFNSSSYTFGYAYDYLGRAASITYPDGEVLNYGYDAGGQVTTVTGAHYGKTFQYVKDIGYNEFGQKNYIKFDNDVETHYSYDPVRRFLANVTTDQVALGIHFQNTSFSFDGLGNITSINNTAAPRSFSQTFSYDERSQLVSAIGSYVDSRVPALPASNIYTQTYRYDSIANLVQKVSTNTQGLAHAKPAALNYDLGYYYDSEHPHRPKQVGDDYYEFDAVGNLTGIRKSATPTGSSSIPTIPTMAPDTASQGSAAYGFGNENPPGVIPATTTTSDSDYSGKFSWDSENHLTQSAMGSVTAQYAYDQDGERVAKKSANNNTIYADKTYQESLGVFPQTSTKHIFVGTLRIASKLGILNNNDNGQYEVENTFYYHADHLGSTEWVTNYQGQAYEHFLYTPHGESWVSEEPDTLRRIEYRYSGKEQDEETGFYYYGARYLNPKTGLWLSGDPAMAEYLPSAPISDEAKKHNGNLPGMGGVFNSVNLNPYHYAGNNPIRYIDPDGRYPGESQINNWHFGDRVYPYDSWQEGILHISSMEDIYREWYTWAGYEEFMSNARIVWLGVLGGVALLPFTAGEAGLALGIRVFVALPQGVQRLILLGSGVTVTMSRGGGNVANEVGQAREAAVAKLEGTSVARIQVQVVGKGSTDIDVIGRNGDLIWVGGSAKMADKGWLKSVIEMYKIAAGELGVGTRAYLPKTTAKEVVDYVISLLGKQNVTLFDEP